MIFSLFKILITEMDYYAMKRKQLQSLCKQHGIPANLRNTEMAHKLTLLLKVIASPKNESFLSVFMNFIVLASSFFL